PPRCVTLFLSISIHYRSLCTSLHVHFSLSRDTPTTDIYTLSLHDALPISHKFEQICRHRLRRQNVGYSNFSQPQSHLSFCVLLQYLVERRRVVTQLGKLD